MYTITPLVGGAHGTVAGRTDCRSPGTHVCAVSPCRVGYASHERWHALGRPTRSDLTRAEAGRSTRCSKSSLIRATAPLPQIGEEPRHRANLESTKRGSISIMLIRLGALLGLRESGVRSHSQHALYRQAVLSDRTPVLPRGRGSWRIEPRTPDGRPEPDTP